MKKLRFKVKVTPEQSEQFQKQVFGKGGTWAAGETEVINTDWPYLELFNKKLYGCEAHEKEWFKRSELPLVSFKIATQRIASATQQPTPGVTPLTKQSKEKL